MGFKEGWTFMGKKIIQYETDYYYPKLESMSREQLKEYQWKRLKAQLERTFKNNEFFQKRWEEHGVTPDDIKDPSDYAKKIPIMGKKDLIQDQTTYPPYGKRLGVPMNKVVQTHITSGTSGLGQEIYGLTQADVYHLNGTWAMNYYWMGIRPGDAVLHFWPMATMTAGMVSYGGLVMLGARYFLTAFYDTKTKLEYMKRFDPKLIMTVPAYLTTLTETAKELGYSFEKDFPSLESILIAASAYPESWALEMEETWKAKLHDHYGSTQKGAALALTCERGAMDNGKRGMMHLLEPFVYSEVVDRETREPVKPGESGELIITPLEREASPIIRFGTDDKVIYRGYEECSCGRPYAGIEAGVIERYDDMVKMKGMNVWPAAIDSVVFESKEVFDYRGRVYIADRGKEEVTMSIEFKSGVPAERKPELLKEIGFTVRERVGIRMNVEETPESFQRIQFKGKRWTDERIKGLERKTI